MGTIRRYLRGTAFLALFSALGSTAIVWHVADDDRACDVLSGARAVDDGKPERMDAARSEAAPDHCFLCHWNRWVRSVPTAKSQSTAPRLEGNRLVSRAVVVAVDLIHGLIPGRSPPA
jgi:hypothetical protein